ncbi:hypothetical protein [Amycolatopsis rubida]|uniref:Uncharacterized protein n=1 Tax=Amycolatopsis rubida TaxID=112413 RepID=A0A1I5X5X1_9PSEU|nr:hypothetical protein [Amycolatopsis rubida]SFQ27372.1 hypothetical protein SAMN05421854_11050 [Amycolatopsis rubida]
MSAIRFHTEHADAVSVRGSERPHGHRLAVDTAMRVLGATNPAAVTDLIRRGVLPRDATDFARTVDTPVEALRRWMTGIAFDAEVQIGGQPVPVTHAVLNTAAVEGPDIVAFLARLHGSVDHRLWIAAEHVPWFTALLADGRAAGILHEGMGWENVIARLTTADGPVVVTSSQGPGFPDVADDDLDDDIDTARPPEDPAGAWRDSLRRLQDQGWWLQLTPDNLRQPAYEPLATFQALLAERTSPADRHDPGTVDWVQKLRQRILAPAHLTPYKLAVAMEGTPLSSDRRLYALADVLGVEPGDLALDLRKQHGEAGAEEVPTRMDELAAGAAS